MQRSGSRVTLPSPENSGRSLSTSTTVRPSRSASLRSLLLNTSVELEWHVAKENRQVSGRRAVLGAVEHLGDEAAMVTVMVDEVHEDFAARKNPLAAAE